MIAVTFNSRALKGQFIQLITNFIVENTNEEPDWSRIKIIHAWGSKNSEGLYFNFCKANNLVCYDYMDACQKYGRNSSAFDRVCEEAVESVTNPQPLYDVILVDEAQDFSKYFLQMCYMSLPHESRMLVYAYDELQSLDNKNVESPEDIFGYSNGRPNVVLDNVMVRRRILSYQNVIVIQDQFLLQHTAWVWNLQKKRGTGGNIVSSII